MVERSPEKAGVGGSTPSRGTIFSVIYKTQKTFLGCAVVFVGRKFRTWRGSRRSEVNVIRLSFSDTKRKRTCIWCSLIRHAGQVSKGKDEREKTLRRCRLLQDLSGRGLRRGQVGTVVETLAPNVFEVEFSDNRGRTYATLGLPSDQLMVLHHDLVEVS